MCCDDDENLLLHEVQEELFEARARDALGMARADERASGEKWKAARDDRAAAE